MSDDRQPPPAPAPYNGRCADCSANRAIDFRTDDFLADDFLAEGGKSRE